MWIKIFAPKISILYQGNIIREEVKIANFFFEFRKGISKIFSRKPHLNICNMKKHVTFILYPVCDISSTTEILCIINILAVLTTTLQKFFTIYVTTLEYYSPRIMRGEVKKHRLICLHGWSAF